MKSQPAPRRDRTILIFQTRKLSRRSEVIQLMDGHLPTGALGLSLIQLAWVLQTAQAKALWLCPTGGPWKQQLSFSSISEPPRCVKGQTSPKGKPCTHPSVWQDSEPTFIRHAFTWHPLCAQGGLLVQLYLPAGIRHQDRMEMQLETVAPAGSYSLLEEKWRQAHMCLQALHYRGSAGNQR